MKKNITKFSTGAIRDNQEGKEDYIETISWTAFKRYAQYMTGKKNKYGAGNFKKGIPIDNYEKSLVRHLQKYLANKYENGKDEKEEDHISAMVFNLFGIMHEESRNHDDSV
jgi:ERCC4-related helicase